MPADLKPLVLQSERWLREKALPLWANRGFNASGFFEEQLSFEHVPVTTVPLRLMVQARQIATYAAASLSGRYPDGAALALAAGHAMCARYFEADGRPGWVFSVDREARVVDAKRDLYAHAFAIFALAWLLRLERAPVFELRVAQTLDVVDTLFADPVHGGYWDCLPRPDGLRRQNPHMHLLEALLALHETTGARAILDRCDSICTLALARFVDRNTGALREYFNDDWSVTPGPGQGSVEPGHLFEWAWLLARFSAACGRDLTAPIDAMIDFGARHGLDPELGRIVDELGEDGMLRAASSRCWPHTEALKALSTDPSPAATGRHRLMPAVLRRLCADYCRPDLEGGWIDHVDAQDVPKSAIMPASSLYHIYFAIVETATFTARSAAIP